MKYESSEGGPIRVAFSDGKSNYMRQIHNVAGSDLGQVETAILTLLFNIA